MTPLDSDEDSPEQMEAYRNELRQRANQSIQQLSSTLKQLNPDGGEVEEVGVSDGRFFSLIAEEDKATWNQKTHSEAVNQLKSLLLKQCKDIPASLSPSKKLSPPKRNDQQEGRSTLPVFQDLVPVIHNQSEYIQHLEAEVKLCKEELQELKQRVRVVVVENEKLQSDLKSKSVNESLKDYTIHNSTVNESLAAKGHITSNIGHSMLQRAEQTSWKNELEQLKVIHQAQVESLDAQVISLRKDLSVSQKECEEVKVQLRRKEKQAADALRSDGVPRVAGLCIKCAQHEAVLAGTHTNQHVQAIDRLTKERDDLLVALHALRTSKQEAQQREWSSCLQVKQAVEMAEVAQLQKARVEVQCEQLSRELARQREHLEREAHAVQGRLAEAREEARAEARKQKEELAHTVSSLSQRVAELEVQLDRAHRDKGSLTNQLEDALQKLSSQEHDNTKMCVELRYQLSRAQLKKEEAERELRELNTKTSRQMEKAAQEVERLSSELVGCRQHLEAVQKDGSQWQAEVLSLAEQLANDQRQLHLTRQDRESAERAHQEEMTSAILSAQERERKLTALLEQTEAQHQQRVDELDGLLSSQNSMIRKLKEECCTLVAKLEELTENSRSKLEQLAMEKQHLEKTVKSLRARCSNMEEQCVQHGRMHQSMKDRLQQLDRSCHSSAQQVCELLAKQNQLIHERNTLTQELQNLRSELPHMRKVHTAT
ncbi:serologically defined colon cancer antigen 8 isoform X1 [Solea senegalensis]|uniref:Serologically defined colon cancer antigen 8 isoform X1 n=1 Tax=Solea senegalensis TaxID=28829 RepID=A0AAV6S4K0_SOLSE|nr:serologically defined colon cancer antigen 8 homolog [Solea senegalensis]KAG7512309.1 serologically defined colon cancer antigen 8 isoform X1 [Solea senegalensis]